MPKKVLFIITKSNWGGAQRYVFDLATNLPKDTFEAVVALGGTGEVGGAEGALAQKLRESAPAGSIRTIFVPSFMRDISLWREWQALKELKAIIRAEQPDVVHLNSSKAGGIGALAARMVNRKNFKKAKIIFTSHGLVWDEDRHALARALIWLASWCTFLLCDNVIVLSSDNFARAQRMPWCAQKIRLVYNGIPPIVFKTREDARAELVEKFALPNPAVWVGSVAELTWNKGLHHLVHAADLLKRAQLPFMVVVMGDGEEGGFLETIVEEKQLEDYVFFLGFVPQASE